MKEKTLELMTSCDHCVIATLSKSNTPQAALVGFSVDDRLGLVIGTYKNSRKYKNIMENPEVAIVAADEPRKLEVQYQGKAQIVEKEELADRLTLHFQKLPAAEKRIDDPNQAWIKVSPTWVRFVDANVSPLSYEEMSF